VVIPEPHLPAADWSQSRWERVSVPEPARPMVLALVQRDCTLQKDFWRYPSVIQCLDITLAVAEAELVLRVLNDFEDGALRRVDLEQSDNQLLIHRGAVV